MSRRIVSLAQLAYRSQKVVVPTFARRVSVQYPVASFAVRSFGAHAAAPSGKAEVRTFIAMFHFLHAENN